MSTARGPNIFSIAPSELQLAPYICVTLKRPEKGSGGHYSGHAVVVRMGTLPLGQQQFGVEAAIKQGLDALQGDRLVLECGQRMLRVTHEEVAGLHALGASAKAPFK